MGEQGVTAPSRRAQVARLRRVALTALRQYPLPEGRLRFVSHGENTTFRHDGAAGSRLVRVHRPQRHGRDVDPAAAVRSELAWLRTLRADTGLEVPEVVTTRDGATTTTASAGDLTRVCSVLRWMDGRILERSARPVHLRRLGAAMARLHAHADGWTPPTDFVRIRWDHEAFFGNVMVYGETPAADCWPLLPPELRSRFEKVASRSVDLFGADVDEGLVHADLHLGNALFHRGGVRLIDFDDCGHGPRLYDLAVALWELRDEAGYAPYRDALVDGYLTHRDLDVRALDAFIAVRQVAFALWFTGMAQVNPDFAGRLYSVHRWSLDMLDVVGVR